jgi:iron-sulfur cluster assembly protein
MAAILTLTPSATARVQALLSAADKPVAGLRLSTPQRGCSGLMYKLDYVETPNPKDEIVETSGGRLFIDGASLLYLLGSEMDWQEDDFTAGFVFVNPNAKGACGCGESFHV